MLGCRPTVSTDLSPETVQLRLNQKNSCFLQKSFRGRASDLLHFGHLVVALDPLAANIYRFVFVYLEQRDKI